MSRLIAIALLFALVLQTGFKVVIYFDYQINKESITQQYCENKAKPEMKCHGKCHLNKLLKEEDKRNQPGKSTIKQHVEISPFVQQARQTLRTQLQDSIDLNSLYLSKEAEGETPGIFHPPSAVL